MAATETVTLTRDPTRTTSGGEGGPVAEITIPKRLGPVELRRELGKGGMGVVWLGWDEMLSRDVAVKFLLHVASGEDDPGFATFLEGARAAAALRHKGLNSVLHADVIQGIPFIVMEFVDGPSLGQVLQRTGPLSPAAARVVLEDACAAVAELHEHGIVHRDIKPANIMLDGEGTVILTDFGLACSRPIVSISSRVEGVAGTPAYMAPEMFDRQLSPRSDVYALGVMAYEVLLGTVPFDGTLDEVRRHHRETPLPTLELAPFHPALADVVNRATNKNPMFRMKSARHLLLALQEAFSQMDQARVNRARGESDVVERVRKAQGRAALMGGSGAVGEVNATYYDRLGTLVQRRRSDTPDLSGDSVERVTQALPCARCGFSLQDQPLTGRCPNCLLLVRRTIDGESFPTSSNWSPSGPDASVAGSNPVSSPDSDVASGLANPDPSRVGADSRGTLAPGETSIASRADLPAAAGARSPAPSAPIPPAPKAGWWSRWKASWLEFWGR